MQGVIRIVHGAESRDIDIASIDYPEDSGKAELCVAQGGGITIIFEGGEGTCTSTTHSSVTSLQVETK